MHDAACFVLCVEWQGCLRALNEDQDLTFSFWNGFNEALGTSEKQKQQDTDRPVCCCNPVEENKGFFFVFFLWISYVCIDVKTTQENCIEKEPHHSFVKKSKSGLVTAKICNMHIHIHTGTQMKT